MNSFYLKVTVVREVSRHQADTGPALTTEEDFSGIYWIANARTLYCASRGAYLELSREGMAKAKRGESLRVSSSCIS